MTGKIAFYGGSFDPIHLGHQSAILRGLEISGADYMLVAPVYAHPYGKTLAPFEQRMAMANIALWAFNRSRVQLSNIEQQAFAAGGRGFTVNTVKLLQTQHAGKHIVIVVGDDTNVDVWEGRDELIKMVDEKQISILTLDRPAPDDILNGGISSTEVRYLVKQSGKTTGLISADIRRYINEKGLYK